MQRAWKRPLVQDQLVAFICSLHFHRKLFHCCTWNLPSPRDRAWLVIMLCTGAWIMLTYPLSGEHSLSGITLVWNSALSWARPGRNAPFYIFSSNKHSVQLTCRVLSRPPTQVPKVTIRPRYRGMQQYQKLCTHAAILYSRCYLMRSHGGLMAWHNPQTPGFLTSQNVFGLSRLDTTFLSSLFYSCPHSVLNSFTTDCLYDPTQLRSFI